MSRDAEIMFIRCYPHRGSGQRDLACSVLGTCSACLEQAAERHRGAARIEVYTVDPARLQVFFCFVLLQTDIGLNAWASLNEGVTLSSADSTGVKLRVVVEVVLDDLVALACSLLESIVVHNVNGASRVVDQAFRFQIGRGP